MPRGHERARSNVLASVSTRAFRANFSSSFNQNLIKHKYLLYISFFCFVLFCFDFYPREKKETKEQGEKKEKTDKMY